MNLVTLPEEDNDWKDRNWKNVMDRVKRCDAGWSAPKSLKVMRKTTMEKIESRRRSFVCFLLFILLLPSVSPLSMSEPPFPRALVRIPVGKSIFAGALLQVGHILSFVFAPCAELQKCIYPLCPSGLWSGWQRLHWSWVFHLCSCSGTCPCPLSVQPPNHPRTWSQCAGGEVDYILMEMMVAEPPMTPQQPVTCPRFAISSLHSLLPPCPSSLHHTSAWLPRHHHGTQRCPDKTEMIKEGNDKTHKWKFLGKKYADTKESAYTLSFKYRRGGNFETFNDIKSSPTWPSGFLASLTSPS